MGRNDTPMRLIRFTVFAAALLLLAGKIGLARFQADTVGDAPGARAQSAQSGVTAFVRMETSTPVIDVLYKYGKVDVGPNGAYGPNVTAPHSAWFLEYQRAGNVDVIDGVVRNDPSLIQEGLRIFHFGLAREAASGSFPGSAWPFHGTAFFLAEAAPSLVTLQASPMASQFGSELDWQTQRMVRAARFMVRSVGGAGKIDDPTKNHRYYEAALALGAVGVLGHDATLVRWSHVYAWKAIRMERPDGVMPEDSGHDSGYQALGMVHASRYLTLVAGGGLYRSLHRALQRGAAWELSRVGPDGSVNQNGDTRTAGCRERDPAGHCKTVFYGPIFSALAHWAAITGESRYAHASYQVWLRSGYGRR